MRRLLIALTFAACCCLVAVMAAASLTLHYAITHDPTDPEGDGNA